MDENKKYFSFDELDKAMRRLFIDEVSLQECQKMADEGDSIAQTELGYRYRKGIGVAKDNDMAIKWFEAAVAQGNIKAMVELGLLYREATGYVATTQALELFERAANAGNERGMLYRAEYYINQLGRNRVERGYYYLRKAAEKGYEPAISWARQLHSIGHNQDVRDIIKPFPSQEVFGWYKKSAEQGYKMGKDNYHQMLRQGYGTVEERIREIGVPEYNPDCEKTTLELIESVFMHVSEFRESIAYSLYVKLPSAPSMEKFEKLLLADAHFKYGDRSQYVKNEYINALNSNGYGSVIDKKDVDRLQAILDKPNPSKGVTRNKWFVIAAVLLLPAIVPVIRLKVMGDPLISFGLVALVSIFLVLRSRKPYGPLVQALQEKQEAVDGFVKKYGVYIDSAHNLVGLQRQALIKKGISSAEADETYGYKYIAEFYQRLKDMVDKYRRMDFGVKDMPKATSKSNPKKKSDPRSRI